MTDKRVSKNQLSFDFTESKLIKTTNAGLIKFKGVTAISSVTVAEALGVRHDNLMKSVKKAEKYQESISSQHRRLDFTPIFKDWEYQDSRNRTYPCKIMNEDGVFALIKVIDTQEAYNYFALMATEFKGMRLERNMRSTSKSLSLDYTGALQVVYNLMTTEPEPTEQPEALFYKTMNSKIHKAVTGNPMKRGSKGKQDAYSSSEDYTEATLREQIAKSVSRWLQDDTRISARQMKKNIHKYLEGKKDLIYTTA